MDSSPGRVRGRIVVVRSCHRVEHAFAGRAASAWLAPELRDSLTVGAVQASWNRPLRVDDVTLLDDQRRKMVHLVRAESEKTLFQLLRDLSDLGRVQVVHPELYLVAREDGSNLEDFVRRFVMPDESEPPSSDTVNLRLQVNGGRLTIADELTGRVTSLRDINVGFQSSADNVGVMTIQMDGKVDSEAGDGAISSDITLRPPKPSAADAWGSGSARLTASDFPLAALQPLFIRVYSDLSCLGLLSGQLESTWTTENQGPVVHVAADLDIAAVDVTVPSLLGSDRLTDPSLTVKLDGWLEHGFLRVEQLAMQSQLATTSLRLTGPWQSICQADVRSLVLDESSPVKMECSGRVHLPAVAAVLPQTLRLQQGLVLQEGTVDFEMGIDAVQGVRACHGRITTKRLVGQLGAQAITWEDPLTVRWDLAATAQGLQLRDAVCESPFLTAHCRGDLTSGELQAQGDLQQLTAELSRFVDFAGLQMAGRLDCQGQWQVQGQQLTGQFGGTVQGFELSAERQRLREADLQLSSQWQGTVAEHRLDRIDAVSIDLAAAGDRLRLELREPVSWPVSDWPFRGELRGQLASWRARLQPWCHIPAETLSGTVALTCDGNANTDHVAAQQIDLDVTELVLHNGSCRIDEPRLQMQGELLWERANDRLLAPHWTLSCSSLAVRGRDLEVNQISTRPIPAGECTFRGDLGRLARVCLTENSMWYPTGNMEGQLNCRLNSDSCDYSLVTAAETFAIAHRSTAASRWLPWWQENRVTLESQGRFHWNSLIWECSQFSVVGDAISLAAQGTLKTVNWVTDFAGTWEYDWQKLDQKLSGWLGNELSISGRQRHDWRMSGPLFSALRGTISPSLQAEFGIGWEQLQAYGILIGPQQIAAKLERGSIDIAPLEATVSGGRIRIDPRIDLATRPPVAVLESPASIENLQITPEIFRSWLKYVAPLLAETTAARGTVSVQLNEARVPLLQPSMSSLTGRVVVQNGEVQPGPIAQQLLGVVQEVANLTGRTQPILPPNQSLATLRPQQIDFQLIEGRVYHRDMALEFGDVQLRTQGSVGLDQTISLLAEIPIQESWLGNQRLLQGLRGQTLQLPIQGTFQQPQIDSRGVTKLTRELVGSTAERVIQDEVQRGLQRLLGPK